MSKLQLINELYALTVVGLRKWPDPKKGEQHSAQELIVTKDPINHPIKPLRPKKRKPLFGGDAKGAPDFASTPKGSKGIGAKWSPMVSPAVAESIKAEFDERKVDAYDVAQLVVDVAVKAAHESMNHKEFHHSRTYGDEEPFARTVEAYAEDAEEFIAAVINRLHNLPIDAVEEKVKAAYKKLLTNAEHERERRRKELESEDQK